MTARELVVTYLATLAAIVVVVAGLAALVAGLPSIAGAVGGAVGGVADAGGAFLDGLAGGQSADLSGDVETDDGDAADDGSDGSAGDDGGSDGGTDGAGDADDADDGGGGEAGDGNDGGTTDDGDGDGSDGQATDDSGGGAETAGAVVVDDGGEDAEDANVSHEPPDLDALQTGLVDAINERREGNYVSALDSIYVDELWAIADDHTRDMVEHGYVGVTAPDGTTATDRFERHDPRCDRVDDYDDALALAVRLNYSTVVSGATHDDASGLVERMMEAWRDETGLLDDDYDDVGVSVRHDNASDALYGAVAAC